MLTLAGLSEQVTPRAQGDGHRSGNIRRSFDQSYCCRRQGRRCMRFTCGTRCGSTASCCVSPAMPRWPRTSSARFSRRVAPSRWFQGQVAGFDVDIGHRPLQSAFGAERPVPRSNSMMMRQRRSQIPPTMRRRWWSDQDRSTIVQEMPVAAFGDPSGSARSRLLSREISGRGRPDRWGARKHREDAHVLRTQTHGEAARRRPVWIGIERGTCVQGLGRWSDARDIPSLPKDDGRKG